MNAADADRIRRRAADRCEYCLMPQAVKRLRFQLDHVVARQHGGSDSLDNLALACGRCNRHKGPNLTGIDATTGQVVRLYDPRSQRWDEHFAHADAQIAGLTDVGRATVSTLNMNHPDDVAVRDELLGRGIELR